MLILGEGRRKVFPNYKPQQRMKSPNYALRSEVKHMTGSPIACLFSDSTTVKLNLKAL